jgi:O-antigen/teichoic acid export membrane protein
MDTGAVKFVSEDLAKRNAEDVARTVGQIISICALCSVAAAMSLVMGSSYLSTSIYRKEGLDGVLLLVSGVIPFAALTTVCLGALQAFQTVRYTILIKYLWEPAGKFLLSMTLLEIGFGLHGILLAIVCAVFLSALFSLLALWRRVHITLTSLLKWRTKDIRRIAIYTVPLAISTTFGVLAPRSDIFILGYWVSPTEVGIYLAAFQTSAVLALIVGSFETALAPILSRATACHDQERLKIGYQSASRLTFAVTAPLWVLLVFFSREIMGVFGKDFVVGASILSILASGQVFNSMAAYANTVLLMSGQSRAVMMNTIVVGTIIVVMTTTLAPLWGLVGAAGAAAGGFIIMNVTRVIQVWRLHGIQPYTAALIGPLLGSAVMACFLAVGTSIVRQVYYPLLVMMAAVVYVGVLTIFGFNKEDKIAVSAVSKRFVPNYNS